MGIYTRASGLTTKNKEEEPFGWTQVIFIKERGKMVKNMGLVDILLLMEIIMKVNLFKV